MQAKQKRSKKRVQVILDTARRIIADQGLLEVTTTVIAKNAGIPVGSIYQYFPDKQSILLSVFDDYLSNIRTVMAKRATKDNTYDAAKLYRSVRKAEKRDDIERALSQALHLYPDIQALEKRHRNLVCELMVEQAQQLGSRWSSARLMRMANFIYFLNIGVLEYREAVNPPQRETDEWELLVLERLNSEVIDSE